MDPSLGVNDDSAERQKALWLAFQICQRAEPCTIEELCNSCKLFQVTLSEIRCLCKLPGGPLRLASDGCVYVLESFPLSIQQSYFQAVLKQERHLARSPAGRFGSSLDNTAVDGASTFTSVEDVGVTIAMDETDPSVPRVDNVDMDGAITLDGTEQLVDTEERMYREVEGTALAETEDQLHTPRWPASPCQSPTAPEVSMLATEKSRETRPVPRFEDFVVESEVGAGGYGTVYKVRRHTDGRIFAIKCPLENTRSSCVRNEIDMLRKLQNKDCIIRFESEVTGKVISTPECGDVKEADCLSVVMEFIPHDKPEVLKKEITIDELRGYCVALFKALAHLHKEKILHLDIKPGNFLFSRLTRRGCLVDFNLARHESTKRAVTKTQRVRSCLVDVELSTKSCKRPFVHQDSPRAGKPSKRGRALIEASNIVRNGTGTAATNNIPTQNFEPWRSAPLGQGRNHEMADSRILPISVNSSPSNSTVKTKTRHKEPVAQGPRPQGGHPQLLNFLNRNVYTFPRQLTENRLPPLKAKVKRIGAELPPETRQSTHPCGKGQVKATQKRNGFFYAIKDGPCVGTKGFRAPEVLMRSLRQTTKVDIWSAGVTLLQLVTGRSPFPSSNTDGALKDISKMRGSKKMEELARSIGQRRRFSKDTFPGVSIRSWTEKQSKRPEIIGRIPASLYDLIEKCLEVNPEDRISAEAALSHEFCALAADASDNPVAPSD